MPPPLCVGPHRIAIRERRAPRHGNVAARRKRVVGTRRRARLPRRRRPRGPVWGTWACLTLVCTGTGVRLAAHGRAAAAAAAAANRWPRLHAEA